jgi:hypothetical protein
VIGLVTLPRKIANELLHLLDFPKFAEDDKPDLLTTGVGQDFPPGTAGKSTLGRSEAQWHHDNPESFEITVWNIGYVQVQIRPKKNLLIIEAMTELNSGGLDQSFYFEFDLNSCRVRYLQVHEFLELFNSADLEKHLEIFKTLTQGAPDIHHMIHHTEPHFRKLVEAFKP